MPYAPKWGQQEKERVARQRLGKKRYRGNEYTHNSRRIFERVVICAVRVVPRKVDDLFSPELISK
jgi:hypothetical protein